ncbi:MAG: hypothetical protein Q8M18_00225 [Bradyrhizobium sp.]|nr:hypothetical protein [Bradyrhizobium sp.]
MSILQRVYQVISPPALRPASTPVKGPPAFSRAPQEHFGAREVIGPDWNKG